MAPQSLDTPLKMCCHYWDVAWEVLT